MQVVTWEENNQKAFCDRKNGINNKASRTVLQYSLEGKLIKEYYSAMQATRETGINNGQLAACCRGTCRTAGGYRWEYKKTKRHSI